MPLLWQCEQMFTPGRSEYFHVDMTKYPVYTDIDTHMVQTLLIYRSLNILGLLVSKNGRI